MDFARSFSYIIEDKNWFKKVGIAALLILTGFGGIFALGWMIEIVKRVSNGDPEPLPGWEDFGDYLMSGLKLFGILLIWSLPIILLTICFSILLIPTSNCYAGNCPLDPSVMIAMLCLSVIVIFYSIIIGLLSAPIFGFIGEGMSFGEMLNPKTAFSLLKVNLGGYALAFLVGGIISSILSSIGVIACFVGAFFGSAFGYAIMGNLIGQAHQKARESLDAPLSIEEA